MRLPSHTRQSERRTVSNAQVQREQHTRSKAMGCRCAGSHLLHAHQQSALLVNEHLLHHRHEPEARVLLRTHHRPPSTPPRVSCDDESCTRLTHPPRSSKTPRGSCRGSAIHPRQRTGRSPSLKSSEMGKTYTMRPPRRMVRAARSSRSRSSCDDTTHGRQRDGWRQHTSTHHPTHV